MSDPRAYEDTGRLTDVARRLGIDESTASRNLQRGAYWQVLEVRQRVEELLKMHPPGQIGEVVRQSTE